MIRIRFEGIISARNSEHPLKTTAKVIQLFEMAKENYVF